MSPQRPAVTPGVPETGVLQQVEWWGVRWHQHYPAPAVSAKRPRKKLPRILSEPVTSGYQVYTTLEECMERCRRVNTRYAEICQWPVELESRLTKQGYVEAGKIGRDRQDLLPCKYQ